MLNLPKKLLKSVYGKHPYASLFKTKPVIKNLPMLLKPIITKETITIYRSKRNAEYQNISTINNTTNINENSTKIEEDNNGTISPIVDQVTQAITVNQVSGTPLPISQNDEKNLNFQPLTITSSDFQNNSNNNQNINLEEIIDVGKFIKEKLEKISDPNFENYEEEESNNEPEKENLEDNDESKSETKQETDENEEIQEEEENPKNIEEKVLEIPDSFARHFVEMGVQETKENEGKESANLKINGEKFYLPLQIEGMEESNEEIKEKNKYFDELIDYQTELNEKLQHELEYPELNDEYEKYRKSAENGYKESREYDFSEVGKPYVIKLVGDFPYENQNLNEDTDKEEQVEVDEGEDNERLEENEEYNEEPEDIQEEVEDQEENDKMSTENKYTLISNDKNFEILNKLLQKKDVDNPNKYNIYWSLEYKDPKNTK